MCPTGRLAQSHEDTHISSAIIQINVNGRSSRIRLTEIEKTLLPEVRDFIINPVLCDADRCVLNWA